MNSSTLECLYRLTSNRSETPQVHSLSDLDADEQEPEDEGKFLGKFRDGTDGASTVKKARTDLSHTSKFTRKYQGAAVYKSKS